MCAILRENVRISRGGLRGLRPRRRVSSETDAPSKKRMLVNDDPPRNQATRYLVNNCALAREVAD